MFMEVIKMPRKYGKRYDFDNYAPAQEKQVDTVKEVEEEPVEKPFKEEIKKSVGLKGKTTTLCNMRTTPKIEESNILRVVQPNTDIILYEEPGDFYRVRLGGAEGYIKKELCIKM